MEKISTSAVALVPRTANLATLAVVVLATWWSGTQRPAVQPQIAVAASTTTAALPLRQSAEMAATGNVNATWPATTTSIQRDSLQSVSYLPRAPH